MAQRLKNVLLFLGLFLLPLLYFRSKLIAYLLRLPPARYKVTVETGIMVPMRDGILLATDHYAPRSPGSYPTILIRSPYGRRRAAGGFGLLLTFIAHRFAERGYHVILQDTRGRFDSQGEFTPYFNEKNDGLDTLDWLAGQAWFNGQVGLWGGSYLGIVQWVIASESPVIQALVPSISGSHLYTVMYPDGVLDLGLALRWLAILDALARHNNRPLLFGWLILRQVERRVEPAFQHLPLSQADQIALGRSVPIYRDWLEHSQPDDLYWRQNHDDVRLDRIKAAVHLIGGWYDFFLRAMLEDYAALKAAGQQPFLTIGPWHHFSTIASFVEVREGLLWFDARLKADYNRLRARPVRIYVMGARQWRDLSDWPPPATLTRFYLSSGRRLGREIPAADSPEANPPDRYRYDPQDPTPIVGGAQFSPWAGPRDNRWLESRPDVLTYTSAPLDHDVEAIGHVRLELFVRSNLAHTDFFGRVCDVHPDGRSINICDGLFRVEPGKGQPQPDGSLYIEVDLWATAYRFVKGHRIRLIVSSGAHPRWNRNLGTGEPLLTATTMKVAEQTIYHDADHPSALLLPLTSGF